MCVHTRRPATQRAGSRRAPRKPRAIGAAGVALLAVLGSWAPARAQEPAFRGTFIRDTAAGDDMEQVINQNLPKIKSVLGKLFKGTARARLREVNRPYSWIHFAPCPEGIATETDLWAGEWKLTTPTTGEVKGWKRRTGSGKVETIDVATELAANTFTHRFKAEDGTRTNVYTLSPDGRTLTLDVTVVSGKLTGPMTYRLVYRART